MLITLFTTINARLLIKLIFFESRKMFVDKLQSRNRLITKNYIVEQKTIAVVVKPKIVIANFELKTAAVL